MPILKQLKKHRLLLDTHVWIWSMAGSARLARSFKNAFERALEIKGVLISPMSIWEVGMFVEKNRIKVGMEVLVHS